MTRATLLALAERVEKAERPSRELSCSVGRAIGFKPDHETDSPWAWSPDYTASLDAALTLYGERPPRLIETDPRRACRDALVWLAEQAP